MDYSKTFRNTLNSYATLVIIILLAGLVLLLYGNSLHSPFILDDTPKIVKNPDIKKISNLKTKLVYPYSREFKTFSRNDPSRPLTYLTFTLNYHFGQLKPFGYHLFDLLVHLGNVILIFFLSRKIIFYTYKKNLSLFPFFVALFFAFHPFTTSVVCYTFARSGNLATFFYILSLFLFIKTFAQNKSLYLLSLLSFFLSLASKPIAVTLPAILFIFDYIFLSDFKLAGPAQRKVYHLGYWTMLLTYLLFRYLYLGGIGDIDPEAPSLHSSYTYLLTQPGVILQYLKSAFLLKGFCINHLLTPVKKISEPKMVLPLLALLFIFLLSLKLYIKKTAGSRLILFCILWFFITLSPTSSFFPTTNLMDDKRLYLPGLSFSLLIVFLYFLIFSKGNFLKQRASRGLLLILAIHLSLLAAVTRQRIQVYQDPLILWKEVNVKYPNSYRALNNLGVLYDKAGQYDKALLKYQAALKINPNLLDAQKNIASLYYDQKKYDEALKEYEKTLKLIVNSPRSLNNLPAKQADIHFNLSIVYYAKQEYDKAAAEIQKTLALNNNLAPVHNNLGIIYQEQHLYRQAISEYQKALEIDPDYILARQNLAMAYNKIKEYDKAIREYRQILSLDSSLTDVRHELAVLLHNKKNYKQALMEYRQVIESNPESGEAHNNLGVLYYEQNKLTKALSEYQKALKLKPDLSDAHNNLGNLYYLQGEDEKALAAYQKALKINPDFVITYKNLGLLYHSQKKYQKALENFKIYLKFTPHDKAVKKKVKSIEQRLQYLTLNNN